MPHLVVFSHLRWNFVFQRPQQLLARLARHHRVLFIEEPLHAVGAPRLERSTPMPGVEVLQPHTPADVPGFHDDQLTFLRPLIHGHLARERIDDVVAWFCTPMALPLLSGLAPRAVVYDCLDDLASFRAAPRQMRQRESALLKIADLVFAAGPSLYESKRALHDRVVCLPSAVDASHYARDRALARVEQVRESEALQGTIAGPRLGYFGVIDERVDLDLVARVADADPRWQLVMVGPVVKIDPSSLPRRPNIHWLGSQPYDLLPQLAAGWDVCLMPFVIDETTRYISPTKTLEYLAAGKPVVSTGVHDVKAMFADVVRIADGADGFIGAIRATLDETPLHRAERAADAQACVWRYSWDDTAAAAQRAIEAVLTRQTRMRTEPIAAPMAATAVVPTPVAKPIVAPLAATLEPQADAPAVAPLVAPLLAPLTAPGPLDLGAAVAGGPTPPDADLKVASA